MVVKKITVILSFLVVSSVLVGCGGGNEPAVEVTKPPSPQASNPLMGESVRDFPDTGLIDQDSNPVSFEGLPEKPVMISFIFTRCPMSSMCPRVTEQMATIQERVNRQGKHPAHFVLVTFDPEYDRPPVLREYASEYNIDFTNFSLWTGPPETIRSLTDRFQIMVKREEGQPVVHNMKTYLIDRNGVIRDRFPGSDWSVNEVLGPFRRMIATG
jgi:protein SCO1/2